MRRPGCASSWRYWTICKTLERGSARLRSLEVGGQARYEVGTQSDAWSVRGSAQPAIRLYVIAAIERDTVWPSATDRPTGTPDTQLFVRSARPSR